MICRPWICFEERQAAASSLTLTCINRCLTVSAQSTLYEHAVSFGSFVQSIVRHSALSSSSTRSRCPQNTGAGLGGGSGNAATALWAANRLTDQPATNAELLEWSGEIGSDISVFFSQGAAYCTGRWACEKHIAKKMKPLKDVATKGSFRVSRMRVLMRPARWHDSRHPQP